MRTVRFPSPVRRPGSWVGASVMLTMLLLSSALVAAPAAEPAPAGSAAPAPGIAGAQLFVTSDRCMACHNQITDAQGQDISIGTDWRASMMANAARDPYWQAAVRREVTDHPQSAAAIENECSACHMPMSRFLANARGGLGQVFAHLPVATQPGANPHDLLAADGVSCALCHQIQPDGLGTEESFTAGFEIAGPGAPTTPAGARKIYGPYEVDAGRTQIMRSATTFEPAQGLHVQSSQLCATCHTLYTHSLGEGGEVIGSLPEQVPYLEWRHSAYYETEQSCQSCHMPVVEGEAPITGVLGQPRQQVSRHVFRGANFFLPKILARHRGELGVQALPQELDAVAQRTAEHLQSLTARLAVTSLELRGDQLAVSLEVQSLAGHKLPSAYPSRRAWLHVRVEDEAGRTVFESGALSADGAIAGNDNDVDGSTYEPHYERIDAEGQVQIYEAVLAGPEGEVTTGLLTAVRYAKDNRLLPAGFDKETAGDDIAVHGSARDDGDFIGGGDRIEYRIDVGGADGPFRARAELLFQPVGYRWAQNLGDYDAMETQRFVRYFDELSHVSGLVLTEAVASTGP